MNSRVSQYLFVAGMYKRKCSLALASCTRVRLQLASEPSYDVTIPNNYFRARANTKINACVMSLCVTYPPDGGDTHLTMTSV